MSKFLFIFSILFTVIAAQTHSDFYTGELSFDYSGTLNGSFHAELMELDSLAATLNGAVAFITSDSTSNRITIPAFQPSNEEMSEFDLFLLWRIDEGEEIEPQSWDVTIPDLEDPLSTPATFLFIPEIDSSLIFELIAPILDGEIDSTNFSDFFLETLTDLLTQAYLPLAGGIELESIDMESMTGNFDGTLFQAGFPPPMVFVTNGSFNMTAPEIQLIPDPPIDFTGEIIGEDILLQWVLTNPDTLLGYTNIYRSVNAELFEFYTDLDFPESEFIDTNSQLGNSYSYYLTASNILGVESEPTITLSFDLFDHVPGDVNSDGVVDVLDIVNLVNFIMGSAEPDDGEFLAADMNNDGILDVLDVVQMVNVIIGG
jgi:hypothetical protein